MEQVHFLNVTIRLANGGEIILLNLELNDKLELMCMNVLCKASMRFIIKIQIKLLWKFRIYLPQCWSSRNVPIISILSTYFFWRVGHLLKYVIQILKKPI